MARAMAGDPLQNFRFHVNATGVNGEQKLRVPGQQIDAGFSTCGVPTATTNVATYKEGNMVYELKVPGAPTYAAISMTRGIIRGHSMLWDWMLQVMEGSGEFRADISIQHHHRDTSLLGVEPPRASGTENFTQLNFDNPARTYQLFNAFPTSYMFSSELSATAGEISTNQLTLDFEFANILENPVP